jgi:hypothetical protein
MYKKWLKRNKINDKKITLNNTRRYIKLCPAFNKFFIIFGIATTERVALVLILIAKAVLNSKNYGK